MDWDKILKNTIPDYIRDADFEVGKVYRTGYLDVSERISELSYLTHDYFRYYGKFPSKIAKYIIETLDGEGVLDPAQDLVFDNCCGSGTTLVEAKLAGYDSCGVDINPFGVLASKVKTRNYDTLRLYAMFEELLSGVRQDLTMNDVQIYVDFLDVQKWFDEETIVQLASIKRHILALPPDEYREFFALGFFAILRRVSRAHDGEVRPHIDEGKKRRDAVAAFEKKVGEMIYSMVLWNRTTTAQVSSDCLQCDNCNDDELERYISAQERGRSKRLGLVVSHPPYLNCFDYVPVYKLEFLWAFGFDEIYGRMPYKEVKRNETRSYPAVKDDFVNRYFARNMDAFRILYERLRPGGCCCAVIGDCTIHKQLFSVHKMMLHGFEKLGFEIDRVVYRSTSYATGRYAYRYRSVYSGQADGKQDAIIFARKPG